MTTGLESIYISPHLDDAILSCAGRIVREVAAGAQVCVINICAGAPDYSHLSAFAAELHTVYGDPTDAVAQRIAEDRAVIEGLGARVMNWDYLDAVYRHEHGHWLYPDRDAIFGPLHPADRILAGQIGERLAAFWRQHPHSTLFMPLGAGHHVDHLLARDAARWLLTTGLPGSDGRALRFYEEYPYIEEAGALAAAQAEIGPSHWQPEVAPIDVAARLQAMAGYQTQVVHLFGDQARELAAMQDPATWSAFVAAAHRQMVSRVERYTQSIGPSDPAAHHPFSAERYWSYAPQ
ncbi:MAG: PIG-L family deacetylase [Chloroflexi bacterium]|nr:PIG-L family deacetylase [Chloroflexota bacterium]